MGTSGQKVDDSQESEEEEWTKPMRLSTRTGRASVAEVHIERCPRCLNSVGVVDGDMADHDCVRTNADSEHAILSELPLKMVVDGDGFCWRVFRHDGEEMWSLCPQDPSNRDSPEPFRFYLPESEVLVWKAELLRIAESAGHTHEGESDFSGNCGPCLAAEALRD